MSGRPHALDEVADFDGVLNKPCVNYGTGSNQIGFPKPADFDIYLVNMNYDFTPYLDSQHPSDFQSDNIADSDTEAHIAAIADVLGRGNALGHIVFSQVLGSPPVVTNEKRSTVVNWGHGAEPGALADDLYPAGRPARFR